MLTIHEAAAAMRRGDLTPVALLDQCLGRIDLYEPAVRAWVVVDRDGARAQAEQLTAELARGEDRGPLHGIPIGVKDVIDVFDLPTGCGSTLWANSIARQDAACVKRLRQAGAVVLGKTVTTAYAYLDPPATRNPWDLERTPGGSSSGSAAAVACGMCLAALGTQTVGSLTRPASYCGVCSYKPDFDNSDAHGVLPLAPSLDHVGVMARCVADLAVLAEALCSFAVGYVDGAAAVRAGHTRPHAVNALAGPALERADPAMRVAFDAVAATLRSLAESASVSLPPQFSSVPHHLRTILAAEAAAFHAGRLAQHPDDYPPRIRALIEDGSAVTAVAYLKAREHWAELRTSSRQARVIGDPVVATPAAPGAAPERSSTGDAAFNAPWSYTGQPTVSLPVGRTPDGLPLGVQLVGDKYETGSLFVAAAWLEREVAYDMRLPPGPTTP